MKKIFLPILTISIIFAPGCSKEKMQQVDDYWNDQLGKLMLRLGPGAYQAFQMSQARRGGSQLLTPEQQEELLKELQKMEEENNNLLQKELPQTTEETPAPAESVQQTPGSLPEEAAPTTSTSASTAPATNSPTKEPKKNPSAKIPQPIEAMLFVSPSCPRCQRLKRDHWVSEFENKYSGLVNITEYDLSIPKNKNLLETMMRKHHLQQVNYPTLFIAGNVVQGYPLNADPVVNKVLSKYGLDKAGSPKQQFLEISMEDEEITGKASEADKKAMKKMISELQDANDAIISSIGSTFGAAVKNQAMILSSQTEKKLYKAANNSANLAAFKTQYAKISAQHDKAINQLMLDNKDKLRIR